MEISGQSTYSCLEQIKTILREMDQQWIDSMNMIFHKALTAYSGCCRATFPGNGGRYWELNAADTAWSILVLPGPAAGVASLCSDRATALWDSASSRDQLTASAPVQGRLSKACLGSLLPSGKLQTNSSAGVWPQLGL